MLRVAADRHLSLLPALPHDADEPALQIEVVHVEPGEFRDPHARSVEELEDRAVTQSGRRGTVRRLDEAPDLLDAQRMREQARYARPDDLARRVVRRDPFVDQVAMERTERPRGRVTPTSPCRRRVGPCVDADTDAMKDRTATSSTWPARVIPRALRKRT
jgi:hypothetical protein